MFGLIWAVTARTHYALRRFMPTNIVLDAIHTRHGLKWGAPAMLLAIPYALAAMFCAGLVEGGGSGWLNVLTLLFVWNALKFLFAGPATLIGLLRVRSGETRAQRHAMLAGVHESVESGTELERLEEPALTSRHG